MSNSLEGQIVCDTYPQLVHVGAYELSGNALYTGAGVCIPFNISHSAFDVNAAGIIKKDLTILNFLSGEIFGPIANTGVTNDATICLFSNGNSVFPNDSNICNDTCMLGGSYNTLYGLSNKTLGSFHTTISSCYSFAVHALSSCIIDPGPGSIIGSNTLLGGNHNEIISSRTSVAAGGCDNYIEKMGESLIMGTSNLLSSKGTICALTCILGGYSNRVYNSYNTTIFNGVSNSITSNCNTMLMTGTSNIMSVMCDTCSLQNALMVTGSANYMNYDSSISSFVYIINGEENEIRSAGNKIMSTTTIYNGCGNLISAAPLGAIYNGDHNFLRTHGSYNIIHNGSYNTLSGSCSTITNMSILNGYNNRISGETAARHGILNGSGNIATSLGTIVQGIHTGENNTTSGGVVVGGACNSALFCLSYVIGGSDNRSANNICASNHRTVIGGQCNEVIMGNNNLVISGKNNLIDNCSNFGTYADCSMIVGGQYNYIGTCGRVHVIWGGCCNCIDPQTACGCINNMVIGGRNNYIPIGRSNTFLVGSGLSSHQTNSNIVNSLIITDLPVDDGTGVTTRDWYRCPGEDLVRVKS